MKDLRLTIRTPRELLVDATVEAIVAEDLDGWFGLKRGHSDLIAALPPGLLVFRRGAHETYVALAGGLLHLRDGWCRVCVREAVSAERLDEIAPQVKAFSQSRAERRRIHEGVLVDLVREAQRRLMAEVRA